MMLPPNRRPPIDLPPPGAPSPTVLPTATVVAKQGPPHDDYNHQPLLVSGLEHYLKPEEDQRFHVS